MAHRPIDYVISIKITKKPTSVRKLASSNNNKHNSHNQNDNNNQQIPKHRRNIHDPVYTAA